MEQLKTPILFIVFNRIEPVKKVFEKIRSVKPKLLFVAADGPRQFKNGDAEKCNSVRKYILDNITWSCELKLLFRDTNLGCGLAVSGAITWFFEQVDEGIILEDDCLPDISFFRFCEIFLEKYRNDGRISIISGCNFDTNSLYTQEKLSYFYSFIPYTWGWATWKRNWTKYDYRIKKWQRINKKRLLKNLFKEDEYQRYWRTIFNDIYKNEPSTWDYQFFFSCFVNSQLAIIPEKNLVVNIGFGSNATHTKNPNDIRANQSLNSVKFPIVHPEKVTRNIKYDVFLQQLCYGKIKSTSIKKRVKKGIKIVLKKTVFHFFKKFLLHVIPELQKLDSNYDFGLLKSYTENCKIDKFAILNKIYQLNNVTVGKRTYIAQNSLIQYTYIGKYCSIGPSLFCGWGIHPSNGLSTSPMFYSTKKQNGITLSEKDKIEERKEIKIGNDVFIGANVTILDGVTIGDGAVIGAGSVVSKDIPPYAIAVGSPIRVIKYRFEQDQISKLLQIKWWEFDEQKLLDIERMFYDINGFIEKYHEQTINNYD